MQVLHKAMYNNKWINVVLLKIYCIHCIKRDPSHVQGYHPLIKTGHKVLAHIPNS